MSTGTRRFSVHGLAMVRRERVLRHERAATHAPLRVNDYQFALGFESTNLRKNRGPPRRRSALRLLFTICGHGCRPPSFRLGWW
jgi:hypothetical protein